MISNPGELGQENYCKGVYVDIENYRRLLTSPEGGLWDADDVLHLDRPTTKDVREWINRISWRDYVFVMFTGHGWYSSADRDRILELKKGEQIASLELLKDARKRTLILDCCQKVHTESLMEKKAAQMTAFAAAEALRIADPQRCKKLFLESIEKAPEGIVTLTSCATGEVSTDDDARGGRYNGSVIECVDDWFQAQAKNRHAHGGESLSVVAAHECAAERTRRLSAGTQNPGVEKPRSLPYFPMAVFA